MRRENFCSLPLLQVAVNAVRGTKAKRSAIYIAARFAGKRVTCAAAAVCNTTCFPFVPLIAHLQEVAIKVECSLLCKALGVKSNANCFQISY